MFSVGLYTEILMDDLTIAAPLRGAIPMPLPPTLNLTFEEYLTYDDGTDNRYELVDGDLVMVPLPTADHSDAIDLLSDTFRAEINRLGSSWKVKAYLFTQRVYGRPFLQASFTSRLLGFAVIRHWHCFPIFEFSCL